MNSKYEIDVRRNYVVVVRKDNPELEMAYWDASEQDAFTRARRLIEQLEPVRDSSGRFTKRAPTDLEASK